MLTLSPPVKAAEETSASILMQIDTRNGSGRLCLSLLIDDKEAVPLPLVNKLPFILVPFCPRPRGASSRQQLEDRVKHLSEVLLAEVLG